MHDLDNPTDMSCDNQATIDVSYNPEHHTRMKHVERQHFFIRELVEAHKIRVPFVSTHDNLADFFTKPLAAAQFFPLRDAIMNVPGHLSTGGRCNPWDTGCRHGVARVTLDGRVRRNTRGNVSFASPLSDR